ncbi:MAG TPA: hypothetical protein VH518_04795 [Tepidisphaeraceae bacterium]
MIRLASSNILLGIALADRTITCAELSGRPGAQAVRKTATLTLATDENLNKPDQLGKSLASFLKEKGFSASRVVVGVPAKWVLAVEKEVPPAGTEQVRAMLRLQAERMSLGEGVETVFDFVGDDSSGKGGRVLLVAMMRKQLERIEQMVAAAGLSLEAVTPMSLALASAVQGKPLLMLARHGAEVVMNGGGQQGTAPRMLRHVSMAISNGHGAPALAPLGLELRRTVAMAAPPTNGTKGGGAELVLFDSLGLSESQVAELSDRMGVRVRGDDGLSALGVQTDTGSRTSVADDPIERYAPAVALAVVGAKPDLLPLNFADSRLAPPVPRRFGRGTVWAAGIAAGIVILVAALWTHVNLLQRDLNDVSEQLTSMAGPLSIAQAVKDRVDFTNGFFKTRTPMLECLREITEAFRDDEPIWATNFTINEDRDPKSKGGTLGRLEGKTTDMSIAIRLADRLRFNQHFSNVSVRDLSGAGGRQRDQSSFSITFSYRAASAAELQQQQQPPQPPQQR